MNRKLIAAVVAAGVVVAAPGLLAQGRCMLTLGSASCVTSEIKPVFAPTGWKTTALDHITIRVADYRAETAFYVALMGWTLRSDDGKQAILDLGNWGSVIFKQSEDAPPAAAPAGGGGRGGASRAVVESFAFAIEPWNAKTVEAELRKRGLDPVADNDGSDECSVHDCK